MALYCASSRADGDDVDGLESPKRYEVERFGPYDCKHFAELDDARAFWIATSPTREPTIRDLLTNEVIEPRNFP